MNRKIAILGLLAGLFFFACEPSSEFETTEAGHEYQIIKSTGNALPAVGDYVYFHGYVTNAEDSLINSTRQTGQNPVLQIPPKDTPTRPGPVEDVLSLLAVGDSALIRIHMDSLPQRPPGFETAEYMYYYIAPNSVKTEAEFIAEQEAEQAAEREQMAVVMAREAEVLAFAEDIRAKYMAGSLSDIQSTETGLKYLVHEAGTGTAAEAGKMVTVHYVGMLTDGNVFDQSFQRGQPIQFPLGTGQVIPGWDEGLALLSAGSKATFFIPSELAYGEQGRPGAIPGGSELVFYVELEDVN